MALVAALLFVHMGFLAGQARVLQEWIDTLRADQRVAALKAALTEEVSGVSVEQFLREEVSSEAPVLATGGQLLWLLVQLPVVETTPAGLSRRSWDETQLQRLSRCLGIHYMLYIPELFDPQLPENRNQHVYLRLLRNDVPANLKPLLQRRNVHLYEFEAVANNGAHGARDRGNDNCS